MTTQSIPNAIDVWNTLGSRCTNIAGSLGLIMKQISEQKQCQKKRCGFGRLGNRGRWGGGGGGVILSTIIIYHPGREVLGFTRK